MKYIRTKDDIFIANKNNVGAWVINAPYKIFDRDIITKADTIEELCDEFVIRGEYSSYVININELDKDCNGWTKEIGIPTGIVKCYGAIWTDKGLIYVAKMNNKGELELL